MSKETNLENVIAVRLDNELHGRLVKVQESENRRAIGEMARILLVEALDLREARAKRNGRKR